MLNEPSTPPPLCDVSTDLNPKHSLPYCYTMDHVPGLSRGAQLCLLWPTEQQHVSAGMDCTICTTKQVTPLHPEDDWQGLRCGYCASHWSDKNKLLYFADAQFSDYNICDRFIASHMCGLLHSFYYPNLNNVFENAHGVLRWWMVTKGRVMRMWLWW